jgi:FtsH-binding integral membrane protein
MPAFTLADLDPQVAWELLRPLAIFLGGMVVYSVFIFKFYRFLARKDIFALDLSKYEHSNSHSLSVFLHVFFYFAKYLVVFPIVAFFWFVVLTVLLSFLAKNQTIEQVLLVTMAVMGAIRATSYYHEDLSRDLAKMLPFAMLGVFVVDLSYFSMESSVASLWQIFDRLDIVVYYLGFIIFLEFILRMTHPIVQMLNGSHRKAVKASLSDIKPVTAPTSGVTGPAPAVSSMSNASPKPASVPIATTPTATGPRAATPASVGDTARRSPA